MTFGLDDWAIGKGLDLGLKYGVSKLREVWAQGPLDRLLLLLHAQFEAETGASLEAFQAMKTARNIREPLEGFLNGQPLDAEALGGEFVRFFPDVGNPAELGGAMAQAARRLSPYARDGSEAEAAIAAQLADGFAVLRELVAGTNEEIAGMRQEMNEQLAGLETLIKVRLPGDGGPEPEPPAGGQPVTPPERPNGDGGGTAARPDPDAQADAAHVLVERIKGTDAPELAAAFRLMQEGRHEEAAARFGQEAQHFEDQRLSELAEESRQNQATSLRAAGLDAEATRVRTLAVRHQIDRGSSLGLAGARALLEESTPDARWRFEALVGEADWPEQPAAAVDALEYGASRGDGEEALHWAAAGVEVLAIKRDYFRALNLARPWRTDGLREGDRLRLELDALEALEETEGTEAAEPGWGYVLDWAAGTSARTQAVVTARRGGCLVRREQLQSATDAYGRALELWAEVPGFEDQVGEAYWSIQVAGSLMGQYQPPHAALRLAASGLRGSSQSPAARAETLEARALEARLNKKLFDAQRGFSLALAIHRRAGNLRGWHYNTVMLGEVYLEANRAAEAFAHFVEAGREERATAAAESANPADLSGLLSSMRVRWERAATYAALAAVGRRLPPETVQSVSKTVLAEAAEPMGGLVAPQPANRAREAVAGLLLSLPAGEVEQALSILRETAQTQHPVLARRAAQALLLATNAGIADETAFLIERYLDDPASVGVASPWVAGRLDHDDESRRQVVEAAASGSNPALEALGISETGTTDLTIRDRVSHRIEQWLEAQQTADPTHEVGIGGYEDLGIMGRLADPSLRDKLASALADLAQDARYPEMTRASATNALFNLASTISESSQLALLPGFLELAAGEYEPSPWDPAPSSATDPLNRFKFSFGSPGDLQAAAFGAASALAVASPSPPDQLRNLLGDARLDQRSNVAAAAYEALARTPGLASAEAIEVGLTHRDARVRAAALRAWMAKTARPPTTVVSARLILDPDLNVRLTFLNLAAQVNDRGIVSSFRDDPDAYVRAWARTKLEPIEK